MGVVGAKAAALLHAVLNSALRIFLRVIGQCLQRHCPKPQSGGKQADLVLSPLALIERIAALVPSPRTQAPRIAPAPTSAQDGGDEFVA